MTATTHYINLRKIASEAYPSIEEAIEKEKDFEGTFVSFSVAELNVGQYGLYRLSRDKDNKIVVNKDCPVTVYSITLARRLAIEELGEIELEKIPCT